MLWEVTTLSLVAIGSSEEIHAVEAETKNGRMLFDFGKWTHIIYRVLTIVLQSKEERTLQPQWS